MVNQRKEAIDKITQALGTLILDIEMHQSINDLSLNIHSENFFRDIFNEIYNLKLKNANSIKQNAEAIDLVDTTEKVFYQITSTRSKEKVENTLKILNKKIYKNYDIKIYYLLKKPNFNSKTITELENKYNIELKKVLMDYKDLIHDINDLEVNKIIELEQKYFSEIKKEKYTKKMALDIVIKYFLKNKKRCITEYDDSFLSTELENKIKLNKLNLKISAKILVGTDYHFLMEELENEEDSITELREEIINNTYRKILIQMLRKKKVNLDFNSASLDLLNKEILENNIDFNKVVQNLFESIEKDLLLEDFNAMDIPWIIIGYFFEICDIGAKE